MKKGKGGESTLKGKGQFWDEGDDFNLGVEWVCPLCGSMVSFNLGAHLNSGGCSICGFMSTKDNHRMRMPIP